MNPELGHFALILAAICWALLMGASAWVVVKKHPHSVTMVRDFSLMAFIWTSLSFLMLIACFLQNDFSVAYVANHSHSDLPILYKISATWGAHEGSMLLWVWILSLWTLLAVWRGQDLDAIWLARAFFVLGVVGLSITAFVLLTSNPFERLIDVPSQGKSLNPLLQDIGLAMHPPILYFGYVGLAIPFAFAIATLQTEQANKLCIQWAKLFTLMAWASLTLGIALGSWWAYYELGWGGWWFWDPVENASLLPWLVATALLHSLSVSEKRGQLLAWTTLLAIVAFSLSLLGTFLVRSGVLTSVHAFTTDPSRGVFILIILGLVAGLSFSLFAAKAHVLPKGIAFDWRSKVFALLVNNLLLMVMMATVLLGTLYPLLIDALGLGKLSVGAPYFNQVMFPLAVPLVLLMGLGLWLDWQRDDARRWRWWLGPTFGITGLAVALYAWLLAEDVSGGLMLGLLLCGWLGFSTLLWWLKQSVKGQGLMLTTWGPGLAHLGFAVTLTGIFLSAYTSVEKDLRLAVGASYEVQSYRFQFMGVHQHQQDNYLARRGEVRVFENEQLLTTLYPEKRIYQQQTMPMTEAAIDASVTRDLFVALGEPLADGAWSLRIQYKPFIRWIWLGALLMALGAVFSAMQRRYRSVKVA